MPFPSANSDRLWIESSTSSRHEKLSSTWTVAGTLVKSASRFEATEDIAETKPTTEIGLGGIFFMSSKICALVGVGPGLGFAIANRFGCEGYRIAMLARRPKALEEHAKALRAFGVEAQGFSTDASDSASIVSAFEKIRQTLGHPEVLVYNAAALKQGEPMSITATELVQDFKVNVAGALTSVQQVVPGMREQRRGTILLTGGGLALEPYPQFTSLAIGKAAIRNLCFSLAKELEKDGIHVATGTVCGVIKRGTRFDPHQIAQENWRLHTQEPPAWEREYVYQ